MNKLMKSGLFAFILTALAFPSGFAQGKQFRLGIISEKPVEHKIEGYSYMAEYVASRLKKFGVTDGKVVVANDLDEMLKMIRNDQVDVVFESAFSTIKMKEKAGMIPSLLVWKKGVKEYRTVFFVRKDSPINTLSDLKGKTIALQDPGSTSAYLLPVAELKKNGLTLVPINGKADPDAVRYLFVEHEKNEAFSVIEKRADTAAFSSSDWGNLAPRERADLRIIHETRPVLRYIASFNPTLPVDVRDAASAVLTGMDRDPEGQAILKSASRTKKIEPLSDSDHQSLAYVKELMSRV